MKLKVLFFPLSLMLTIVIFIWMIKPEWDDLSKTRAAYTQAQAEMQQLTDNINRIDQVVSEYERMDDEKMLIDSALPYEPKRDELYAQMYAKARDAEVFITKVGITENQESESCKTTGEDGSNADLAGIEGTDPDEATSTISTPICLLSESVNIEISGDYLKIKKYIGLLEQMNRMATIKKIEITKATSQEGESTGNITGKIEFLVYYKNKLPEIDPLRMVSDTDPVGSKLIIGTLNRNAIQSFKDIVSSRPADPIAVTASGKEDIFN